MKTFNKGDIVRVLANSTYQALAGMIFEVTECDEKYSGNTLVDVTALNKINSNWGWKGRGLPKGKFGWFILSNQLELLLPAEVHVTPKAKKRSVTRDNPLPKHTLTNQCQQLLTLLEMKGSTTALEASGVYRIRALPRRIADLKEAGYTIVTKLDRDTTGQRYARYYLKGTSVEAARAA